MLLSQSFSFTFPDMIDIRGFSSSQVFNGFILTLPFRVRTGSFFRLRVGDSFELAFRNRLNIPEGTPSDDVDKLMWEGKTVRPREQFYTEVLILDETPPLTPDFHNSFIRFMDDPDHGALPKIEARYFAALSCLNDAIVGYHHATNSLFGGAPVERLGHYEFFERLRYLHTFVCAPGHQLSDVELQQILDARAEREIRKLPGRFTTAQLEDVPDTERRRIQFYTQLHQRFLFYQFALDAKSAMLADDYVSAVLFAVITLEGVHSALLQMRLSLKMADSIIDNDARERRAELIANKMLKEIGFLETLEMTCILFLDAPDRPPEDEVQNCKLGVTIRNDIVHALAKNGQYRLRNRTNKQICDAYVSVLKVFTRLVPLVERDAELNREGRGDHH